MTRPSRLDEIRITELLNGRAPRPRDLQAENDAFRQIARSLASPSALLRALTDAGMRLCGAGSCGVSLLETDAVNGSVFRWVSLSGALAPHEGKTTPADFSPCGVCLAYGTPQLFSYPGRHFKYFDDATPRITEGLVLPFRGRDQVMGTIWVVAHDDTVHFSSSDVTVMTALAEFTAVAAALLIEDEAIRVVLERERAALAQADAASRAKDVFLATISHELRTPLNAILGWGDVLAGAPPDAPVDLRALSAIQDNTNRLVRLVDDLLDASRAGHGQLHLSITCVDLGRIVRRITDDMGLAARERGLALDAHIAEDTVHVLGDEERLGQVICNLLDNALKFTARGGQVRVELSLTGDEAVLEVSDSGIGIEPHFLPHVFEPFTQAGAGLARRHGGLGLGLSIARDIIATHGGRITASSGGLQRGSCFTVTLARADAAARAAAEPYAPPAQAVAPIAGTRVLLVDDQRDGREALASILTQHGASVLTAASAADALAVLRRGNVDVLLADIAMPGEDGFALIAQVRALESPGGRRVPAVAVTALAAPADRQRALAAGFDVHLPKPVRTTALMASLASLRHTAG